MLSGGQEVKRIGGQEVRRIGGQEVRSSGVQICRNRIGGFRGEKKWEVGGQKSEVGIPS